MKEHAQYADALALYAMNALDDQRELADLQAHLGACGECRRELEALRGDTALLALSASGPQPPQRVRQRLMQAIAAEPHHESKAKSRVVVGRLQSRWPRLAPVVVAALLAVIGIGLLQETLRLRRNNERLAAEMQDVKRQAQLAQEVLAMLNDPQAVRMTLVGVKTPPQPQVKTVYKPEKGHVLLLANNLAPLPDDKVYELWLIPMGGGAPMPAGTFQPDEKGNTMMMHAMENPGVQARAFAVTIEPRGGSPSPTTQALMMPAS